MKPTSSSAYGWQILPDSRSITRKTRASSDDNGGNNNTSGASNNQPIYSFDAIFSSTSQTEDIFNDQISPLLEKILPNGDDVTIIACGSTGTGKTHTMLGSESDYGIVHLTGRYIFGMKNCSKVTISHLEIYNDEFRDLLCDNGRASLTRRDLSNPNDLMDAVDDSRRRASESLSRENVSRQSKCHSIFQITVERSSLSCGDVSVSTINLVELAGCEDVTRYNNGAYTTGADGGILMNRSLGSLSRILSTTTTPASSQISRILHPYISRNNASIAVIACISPSVAYLEDTKLVLQYLSSAAAAASAKASHHQQHDEEVSAETTAESINDLGQSPNKYQILRSRLNAKIEEAEESSSGSFQDNNWRQKSDDSKTTHSKHSAHKKTKSCVFDFRNQDNYDHCSASNDAADNAASESQKQQRHRKNNSCSIDFGRSVESHHGEHHHETTPPSNEKLNCSSESRRRKLQSEREKLTSWKLGRIIEEQEVNEWMLNIENAKHRRQNDDQSDNNDDDDEEIRIRNEMTSSELSIKEIEERLRAKLKKNKERQQQRRQRRSFPLDERENRINSLRRRGHGNDKDDDRPTTDDVMERQQLQLDGCEVGEIMHWQRREQPKDNRDDIDEDECREDVTSAKRDPNPQNIIDDELQAAAHGTNNSTLHDIGDLKSTNDVFMTTPNKTPHDLATDKTTATTTNDDDRSSMSNEIVEYKGRSKNNSSSKKKKKVHNLQTHTADPISSSCPSPSSASSDLVYLLRKAEGLARHQDDNITLLTTDLAHYKQLSSSLKNELSDLEVEYSSEVKTLRLFIDEMEREKTEQETMLKQEISCHKLKINTLQDELSRLHQIIATNKDNHKKEINSLLQRLEESEEQNIHYKQQLEENSKLINNLKGDVHSQKEMVSLMNNHISELEEMEKKKKMEHQSELKSLHSQLKVAQADHEDFKQHHQTIHKKDQNKISTLEKQLLDSQRIIKSLNLNLNNFEEMATQSQADYESQLQSLRQKLRQTEKDKTIIEQQSNDKTKTIDNIQRNLTELQTAHTILNQKHQQFKQQSNQTTSTHQKTTQNLQDQLKKQSKELSSLQSQTQHLQSERDSLQSQNDHMKDEISMLEDELIKTITFVQDGVGRQKDTITSLQSEITRQREMMERSREEHERVVEEWKDRNKVLTVELEKKAQDVNLLSREMVRLTREEKTKKGGYVGGGAAASARTASLAATIMTKGVDKNESSSLYGINTPIITPSESSYLSSSSDDISLNEKSSSSSSWRDYGNLHNIDTWKGERKNG